MTEPETAPDAATECLSCKAISGERPISPGPRLFEGEHWLVEHVYPTALKGWLVIVSRRHVEALHSLAQDEFIELGDVLGRAVKVLRGALDYEKEYTMCFAEAPGFKHVHFHVVPKPHGLPQELSSGRIFGLMDPGGYSPVPTDEIAAFCEEIRHQFA